MLTILMLGLPACTDPRDGLAHHVSRDRFQQALLQHHIDPWMRYGLREDGFLMPELDQLWQPFPHQKGTLVSQGRILYVFATGNALTGEPRYRDAVRRSADFLLKRFRDQESGGWYRVVDEAGAPVNRSAHPYGYTFAIFGLCHAFQATGDKRYQDAAMALYEADVWQVLHDARHWQATGRIPVDEGNGGRGGTRDHNALLHLYEALLVLHQANPDPGVWRDIEAISLFLRKVLYQEDFRILPWRFDAHWRRLPAGQNGEISFGHQLEWAVLLDAAVDQGLAGEYRVFAETLMDDALRRGYDPATGGLFSTGTYDGTIPDRNVGKRWWEQAELVRALIHFAARGREDLWPRYQQTMDYVERNFMDLEHLGWSRWAGGNTNPRQHKAEPYHIVNMYIEGLGSLPGNGDNQAGLIKESE